MKTFNCPQKEPGLGEIDEVRPKLTAFELETLSLLLHHWAKPEVVKKRANEWDDKLPKFRSAVIAGMGSGAREKGAPREIACSEYRAIHHAIKWLQNNRKRRVGVTELIDWVKRIKVPYEIEGCASRFTFERPIPLSVQRVEDVCRDLVAPHYKPSEIARLIAGSRLGCSEKKIKAASSIKTQKRDEISFNIGLLVSVFLDLCSFADQDLPKQALIRILSTLYSCQCHLLSIYYMIQRSHVLKEKLFVGDYNLAEVERLCDAVCPDSKTLEYEPFLRLI